MPLAYQSPGPTREETNATRGPLLLEFGTAWCGHCQLAAPAVEAALTQFQKDNQLPHVPHIQVEDGPGRRLGRSFRVKLWPTLIAIQDGVELARVVRPTRPEDVCGALSLLKQ
jgi:thioredoxin 1